MMVCFSPRLSRAEVILFALSESVTWMTKTISDSEMSRAAACHSSAVSGAPQLCAATRSPSECSSLISASAFLRGERRLVPIYKTVIFTILLPHTFKLIFDAGEGRLHAIKHGLLCVPIPAPRCFKQSPDKRARGMRVESAQPL